MRRTLIVFAKAPRMGSVKTRLARGIGDAAALRFYRATLSRTIGLGRGLKGVETLVRVTPDAAKDSRAFPAGLPRLPQGCGDIGERMKRALDAAPGDAVLVGCDIPGMTADDLRAAFAALRRHEAVFGPAADGGFWLVGLKRGFRPARLFRGVRWSSPETLADSLAALPAHARVARLRTLNDVDDVDDYAALGSGSGGTS
ncbi:TIGR04282 family arsenosugar biosynthesis glycosyltransferase [Minwuia thermotolerans]|uniref:Glycosyltransferase n=1 Tax=Minwuia thermotolerans TaxID=2056226 RepID=A0A2M9G415_9PROT|nr:TIGR04282 family arsenosugar biosynthesis glycosyltransferase [Minwuia thermotolerans]PJK30416.1 hypothetical protein CVT23_07105 [Minwuia thermotolerans]